MKSPLKPNLRFKADAARFLPRVCVLRLPALPLHPNMAALSGEHSAKLINISIMSLFNFFF